MTEHTKKTQQIRSEVIADLEEMQQLVTGTVNDVTQNVKTVHQKIASLPADYVGQIKPLENVSKDVQKVQEKTLGYAYDLIKVINTTFNGISKDIITKTNRNIL
jgi:prophage DNA circulation protein